MSRYIDADKLIDFIDCGHLRSPTELAFSDLDVIEMIKKQPTADVVEVVRCKDCIHNHTKSWNQGKRDNPSCHFTDLIRSNEFYCGFGERAEE